MLQNRLDRQYHHRFIMMCHNFSPQLAECMLGEATTLLLLSDMKESKKLLIRARELATEVLGPRHHYVAAIINKVFISYVYLKKVLDN